MKKLFKQPLKILLSIFIFVKLFVLTNIFVIAQDKLILNQKQAIEIAESFVLLNGYTEIPASRNAKLYLEEGENASDLKSIFAVRLNSIEPKPVFALVEENNEDSFWIVRFLFTKEIIEGDFELGREVRVSLDGKKIWMISKPVPIWEAKRFGDCTGEYEKTPQFLSNK